MGHQFDTPALKKLLTSIRSELLMTDKRAKYTNRCTTEGGQPVGDQVIKTECSEILAYGVTVSRRVDLAPLWGTGMSSTLLGCW